MTQGTTWGHSDRPRARTGYVRVSSGMSKGTVQKRLLAGWQRVQALCKEWDELNETSRSPSFFCGGARRAPRAAAAGNRR